MLLELHIRNFALIEEIDLRFDRGLNVLTGETGAGKSIVIDAVNLVLGGRASQDYIRSNKEKAQVEAVFDISGLPSLQNKILELGIEVEEDGTLLMSREISRGGKNTCRINGRPATLSMYEEIGRFLIDIHGQHDHQSLLNPEKHLELLDNFGGKELIKVKNEVTGLFSRWNEIKKQITALKSDEKDQARQMDMYRFQLEEIDNARLAPGEDEELSEERKILLNAEKLSIAAETAYNSLYKGADNTGSALDLIHIAVRNLKELTAIDSSLNTLLETVENAFFQLEEAAGELRNYKERMEFNPYRLEEIENRLDLIKSLKRKYGDSIEEILKYRSEVAAALNKINSREEELERLEAEFAITDARYQAEAIKLRNLRKDRARILEDQIRNELKDLGMDKVEFKIDFKENNVPGESGLDTVEFLFTANPGEPLKPLARIASGGEMARVMLALKTILARVDEIPTLIFDEVDSGVGGRAAQAVAEKMALVGRSRQVISVTHAPVIASFADSHYFIHKENDGSRTRTSVRLLDSEARVREIARMQGVKDITEITLRHAEELMQLAENVKKNL